MAKPVKLTTNPNATTQRPPRDDEDSFDNTVQRLKSENPPPKRPLVAPFGPPNAQTVRPEGDNRDAAQIIRDNPLLANLSEQHKKQLISLVGDFNTDADAAYRAVKVLDHIEHYDQDGKKIISDNIGNNKIDGYTSHMEAKHGTEAGRLKDVIENGYGFLKGGEQPVPSDPPVRTRFDPLGPPNAQTVRLEDDNRDAAQIIRDNPLLANLSEKHKEYLKTLVGDFNTDADAAYRAVRVLNHVENYDEDGKRIDSDKIGNNRIDGFTSKGHATHGTESGRLQDVIKYGYGFLKGGEKPAVPSDPPTKDTVRPAGDTRDAATIIKDNPLLANLGENQKNDLRKQIPNYETDADAAYRASRVVDHVENYSEDGKINTDRVGNHRIDGVTSKGHAQHGTEAGRLQDFGKYGFEYLKSFDVNTNNHDESKDFAVELQKDAYEKIIRDANLPQDRQDIVNNPGKYSAQQKYAAQLELTLARDAMIAGVKDFPKDDREKKVTAILKSIEESIQKLESPEVAEYRAQNEGKAIQDILKGDPARLEKARSLYADMKDRAVGLDQYVGKDKDTLQGMADYLNNVSILNDALGKDGKPLDEDITINIVGTPQFQTIMDAFRTEFQDPAALEKLAQKPGMNEEKAFAQLNSYAALFTAFGAPTDEINMALHENMTNLVLRDVAPDDFQGSGIIGENGEVDQKFLNDALDHIRRQDPEATILNDEKGHAVTNAHIVAATRAAWDAVRNTMKVNSALSKMNMAQFIHNDAILNKTFSTGTMHFVSGLLGVAVTIARSATGKKLPTAAKIAAAGNGIQAFGVLTQGFEFTQRTNPAALSLLEGKWIRSIRNPETALGRAIELRDMTRRGDTAYAQHRNQRFTTLRTNIMNFGKTLNGTGGLMAGTAGIALGLEQLKRGDKLSAGLFLTQGISNTLTALGPISEALAPLVAKALSRPYTALQIGRLFAIGGSLSLGLNVAAFLAPIVTSIVELVIKDKKQDKYEDTFQPTLHKYGIDTDPEIEDSDPTTTPLDVPGSGD